MHNSLLGPTIMVSGQEHSMLILVAYVAIGKPLKEGQVILCLVLPGANSRSVPVTINPDQVYTALVIICVCLFVSEAT